MHLMYVLIAIQTLSMVACEGMCLIKTLKEQRLCLSCVTLFTHCSTIERTNDRSDDILADTGSVCVVNQSIYPNQCNTSRP